MENLRHHQQFLILFMKICLNIKKLKGSFKSKEPIKVAIKIGEQSKIQTELSYCQAGCYAFMEKHHLKIPQKQNVSFVQIRIITELEKQLALITVFYVKFKQFTKISINNNYSQCVLHYELKQQSQGSGNQNDHVDIEKSFFLDDNQTKLHIFKLGLLLIRFAQRIDLLVYIYNKTKYIFLWKNQIITISFGILLSFFIYYLKFSIFLAGVTLYFCKDMLIRKFQRIHRYDTVKERILFPEHNALFLQISMQWYIDQYEAITKVMFDPDKTFLINIIKLICKMSLVNIILFLIFDIQDIVILSIWSLLLLGSPIKNFINQKIKPLIIASVGEYFKIVDKLSNGITNVIKKSFTPAKEQHSRQFYYYQYQGWSVFGGWIKNEQKFSDESFECIATVKSVAPQGWAWTTEWKIDYEGSVDEEGFEYKGKINRNYSQSASLSTWRRRKWKRLCIMNPYE